MSENVEKAKEWIRVIYRGHTYLFTARDQFVDEHGLAVLGRLKVFPQLLVLPSDQRGQSSTDGRVRPDLYLLFSLQYPVCMSLCQLLLFRRSRS